MMTDMSCLKSAKIGNLAVSKVAQFSFNNVIRRSFHIRVLVCCNRHRMYPHMLESVGNAGSKSRSSKVV